MKAFREIDRTGMNSTLLREQMDRHGYILVRDFISREMLSSLLKEITQVLYAAGWLLRDTNPADRIANTAVACADGDPVYKDVYDRVFSLYCFHAMPHSQELQRVMKLLVGEELLIHPKSAARLIFPNFVRGVIHAHQDHTAVGGDAGAFTAWIPMHDCPEELGPLCILEGSHRYGLQSTAGKTGYIAPGTERGDAWVGGTISSGDLLIFHSLTVHKAVPNRSNQLRISLDCRFQSYLLPVNPGALVFTGSGRRSWEQTYAHWPENDLKYYWTTLPLRLKPSRLELVELSRTSGSPEARERYLRILERIDAESPLLML